ncbi:MAG: PH domain-containing protein [Acutalibacteraceae bacterium]
MHTKRSHRRKNAQLRPHPYTVAAFLYHFAYLLIIPLLQHILFSPRSLAEIITSFGINIFFVLIIVFTAAMSYKSIYYSLNTNSITLRTGWIVQRHISIPYKAVQSVIIQRNILPAVFGAVKVFIDAPGAAANKSDVRLVLSFRAASRLIAGIYPKRIKTQYKYKSSLPRIFIMAATWSNSFTGLLIFAPFVKKVGAVLGEQFSQSLYKGVNLAVYIASIGLPPIAAYIAGVLVFGYAVAFLVQIFRYGRFSVEKKGSLLIINRGLVSRTSFITDVKSINAVSSRQSVLMLLFRLKSIYIHTIGVGKSKGDKSLLIAAQSKKTINTAAASLLGQLPELSKTVKPHRKRLKSFLYLPLFSVIAATVTYYALNYIGIYREILNPAYLLSLVVIAIWFFFRIAAYRKTALSLSENSVIACGFKRLNITENIVIFDKVQFIGITQSIAQKVTGSCNVKIYVYAEKATSFRVKNLDLEEALSLINEAENKMN